MHLPTLIIDLAMILGTAGLMSMFFQKIGQPVVLGYIIAGVIVGPYTPPAKLVYDIPSIKVWAELGVIFLMFTLGLEFSFRKLLKVGATSCVAAGFEVIFFLLIGYAIGRLLQWSHLDSVFLGAMLSISSTTIIIKALDELKLKTHRFANVIFGILIVEDLIAILLLVGLTTIATSETVSVISMLAAALQLILVVGGWFITGYFIVPRVIKYIARQGNNEMLTLFSIGLCLGLVVLASHLGYSPALGAFIMGSILAETELIHKIEGLMAPIKDVFGAIFFVSIGMLIDPKILWEHKEIILLLSVVTIVGKIISTSAGALITGQTFRNSIQVGMGLAQIGEFSFIIAGLGVALKVINPDLYPIGVAVSLITTFTTPYFIKHSGNFADALEKRLPPKIKNYLDRYAAWGQHRKTVTLIEKDMPLMIFRWLANGVIVTLIFDLGLKYFAPKVTIEGVTLNHLTQPLAWVISFIVSSPFIWAMLFTSRDNYLRIRKEGSLLKALLILSFPILTAIWVALLSTKYFPLRYVFAITSIISVLIYFVLFKKLESYYRWFEKTFLETFNEPAAKQGKPFVHLAPWDSHLVNIEIHPGSPLVGKTLHEAHLRSRFGVNVVVIQRVHKTIVSPRPNELLLPKDILVVLGNDEQIDLVRAEADLPSTEHAEPSPSHYKLKHITLAENSRFIGITIRQSQIRERFHAMVVGIERENRRIMNPDTDLELKMGDVLWVVGETTSLDLLIAEMN